MVYSRYNVDLCLLVPGMCCVVKCDIKHVSVNVVYLLQVV